MDPQAIVNLVADAFRLRPDELMHGRRTRLRTTARWVAVYMLRQSGNLSLSDIARTLKYKDHSTVVYALRELAERIKTHDDLARMILDLTAAIKQPAKVQ